VTFFKLRNIATAFLEAELETWPLNDSHNAVKQTAEPMIVVNDTAESNIALIEQYNSLHTCDEGRNSSYYFLFLSIKNVIRTSINLQLPHHNNTELCVLVLTK